MMTIESICNVNREFVLAGNATFTIQEPNGVHHTYHVQKVEANDRWAESYFARLLTGPDNTNDYTYIGKLDPFTGQVNTTFKSASFANSFTLKLLNRVLARVWSDDHAAFEVHGYKLHHEGYCGRCGRMLTTPESVKRGIGPECWKKM